MLVFGVDTTTKTAAAAAVSFENGSGKAAILSEMQTCGKLSHSENLMPMIDYTLKCAGVALGEIDLFAVSSGPGSFTGIRIGIATVKGLAFSGFGEDGSKENKNCAAVSSLHSLAWNFYEYGFPPESETLVLPVIDARRKQVYNAVFGNLEYIKGDRIITVSALETELNSEFPGRKIVFAGDGADMCYNEIKFDGKVHIPDMLKKPSAASLCRIAYEKYKKGGLIHPRVLAPSYIIKTQAEREYKGMTEQIN